MQRPWPARFLAKTGCTRFLKKSKSALSPDCASATGIAISAAESAQIGIDMANNIIYPLAPHAQRAPQCRPAGQGCGELLLRVVGGFGRPAVIARERPAA